MSYEWQKIVRSGEVEGLEERQKAEGKGGRSRSDKVSGCGKACLVVFHFPLDSRFRGNDTSGGRWVLRGHRVVAGPATHVGGLRI